MSADLDSRKVTDRMADFVLGRRIVALRIYGDQSFALALDNGGILDVAITEVNGPPQIIVGLLNDKSSDFWDKENEGVMYGGKDDGS